MEPGCWAAVLSSGGSLTFSGKRISCSDKSNVKHLESVRWVSAGSHLASRFGASLFVGPGYELGVLR